MQRQDGRKSTELRPVKFELNYVAWPEGSVLIRMGRTHVLCNVTVENDLPALEHLRKESVQFVLVWDDEHLSGRPRLAGLFPLVRNFGYRGVPVPYFSMWRHKHCFLTTPLLRLDCAQTALLAFLNHLDRKTPGGCLMKFDFISGDGPFYEYLRRYSIEHNRLLDENMAQERPAMCANAPFDEYIKLRMSHKSYQKFMRKLKHLEDMGEITYEKTGS